MKQFVVLILVLLVTMGCFAQKKTQSKSAFTTVIPKVISTLPHEPSGFTQGLIIRDGFLFESDGQYGQSALKKIDLTTGAVLERKMLGPGYFAEGLAYFDNTLIQLTWRESRAFVYMYPSLTLKESRSFKGEGWGLASDNSQLFLSNGSDTIYVTDKNLNVLHKIAVTMNKVPVRNLNELEYVNGKLLANVWYSNFIVEIELSRGTVSRVIDCTSLVAAENSLSQDAVLNGIAYDQGTGLLYITGKLWKNYYRVKLE